MKRLFLAVFAVGLIGCANQPAPPPVRRDRRYPYSRYAFTADVWGYRSPSLSGLEHGPIAAAPPRSLRDDSAHPDTPGGACLYLSRASPAAQDEIKAIEVELNWRYQHGDKSAELKEFWPSARRHIGG